MSTTLSKYCSYIVLHDSFVDPLLMKDDGESGAVASRDTIDEILCRDWGLRCPNPIVSTSSCDDAGTFPPPYSGVLRIAKLLRLTPEYSGSLNYNSRDLRY